MKKLTRDEMKNVVGGFAEGGGTTCYVHSSDWSSQWVCSGDCAEQAAAQGAGFKWCCASCP